jgi:hypothetical protein
MRPAKRTLMAVLVAALLVAAGLSGCQKPTSLTVTRTKDPDQVREESSRSFEGTLSCSGRGCHASLDQPEEGPRWPCSYSLWLDNDPHANAHRVLSGELGKKMGKALHIEDVSREPRCLACHTTPQAAELTFGQEKTEEWASGVGCESCHGPARKWLVPHRDKEKWKKLSPDEKEREFGFKNLTTPVARARVCVGCHVGAPASDGVPLRDMNHDHIAAGHPRLMFEFDAFMANLPPHWTEHEPFIKLEGHAPAWLAGQVVSARAALDLLADRAKNSKAKDRPWPEFSEYDCYACHHGLQRDSWRQQRGYPKGTVPGRLRLSRWYLGLLDEVAPLAKAPKPGFLPGLENAMRRPYPQAADVEERARKASKGLDGLAGKLPKVLPASELGKLRRALARLGVESCDPKNPRRQTDWDSVEQMALGILALSKAEQNKTARELLKLLAFREKYDSYPGFRRIERDGQASPTYPFDEQLKELFAKLQ